jgi:hypothetical protein
MNLMGDITSSNPLLAKAFELKRNLEGGFIELGKLLKLIRDSHAWESEYESFDNPASHNFLEQLGMKKQTVNKLILIVEKFLELGHVDEARLLDAGGWSKLAETLPYVSNPETAEEMLHLAQHTKTQLELRDTLREKRTGINQMTCNHADTYELHICRTCGSRIPVFEPNITGQ